ncbi:MAG TPA: hypothetical protein VGA69_11815 [Nitriliruptorales bacterium]
MRSTVLTAVLVVLAVGASGCDRLRGLPDGQPRACTLIGCENALTFQLTDVDLRAGVTYDVEVCVDDSCTRADVVVPPAGDGAPVGARVGQLYVDPESDQIQRLGQLGLEGDLSGVHEVSLEVRDEAGELLVATRGETGFERSEPNGEGCPPVCWAATVEV